jgi:transaldolase
MHKEDRMAFDKLAEGIDGFSKAITDLENELKPRLATI